MTISREIWERSGKVFAVYFDRLSDLGKAWIVQKDRQGEGVSVSRKYLVDNGFRQPTGISRRSFLIGAAAATAVIAISNPTKVLLTRPIETGVVKLHDGKIITDFVRLETFPSFEDPDTFNTGRVDHSWVIVEDITPKSELQINRETARFMERIPVRQRFI